MQKKQSKQNKQYHMVSYVVLPVVLIGSLFIWSLGMVQASSSVVYEVHTLEKKIQSINEEIARHETDYFVAIQDETHSLHQTESMVSYSLQDQTVRYAQVGGTVYSLLDRNQF